MHAGKKQTKNVTFSFLVAVLLLLFTNRERCAEKNKVGFCFLFDTGAQSMAFSVTRYVLLIFLTATGSCCRPPCRPAIMCVSCYRLLQGHPAWINGAMEHLDPQETQDTTRICRFRTTSPVQRVRYVRSVGVYSGIMYRCVRYVLRVARVDSGGGMSC